MLERWNGRKEDAIPGMGGWGADAGIRQRAGAGLSVSIYHLGRDEGMWPCGSEPLNPNGLDTNAVSMTECDIGQLVYTLCAPISLCYGCVQRLRRNGLYSGRRCLERHTGAYAGRWESTSWKKGTG